MQKKDYMLRAIELAKQGVGWTSPNPLVGAVIVKDGRIIGEGYHEKYGELHAERNAIKHLKESAEGATIYVTLEPCCHYGKQPPCTRAIVEAGIKKVVIGSRDPNPLVAGKGVRFLRTQGIEVEEDFMREECDALNPVFFHFIQTKRPYIVMKYAMTMDGKIATKTGKSKWITSEQSRKIVHEMRHQYIAVMAGIGTVLKDDPMLNTRIEGKKSPIRIICDSRLQIPLESKICQSAEEYPTMIACAYAEKEKKENLEKLGIQVLEVPQKELPKEEAKVDLAKLMEILGEQNIDSILLEGGGTLNESMLRENLVNEVNVFLAPKIFGGREAPSPVGGCGICEVKEAREFYLRDIKQIGDDVRLIYRKEALKCLQES